MNIESKIMNARKDALKLIDVRGMERRIAELDNLILQCEQEKRACTQEVKKGPYTLIPRSVQFHKQGRHREAAQEESLEQIQADEIEEKIKALKAQRAQTKANLNKVEGKIENAENRILEAEADKLRREAEQVENQLAGDDAKEAVKAIQDFAEKLRKMDNVPVWSLLTSRDKVLTLHQRAEELEAHGCEVGTLPDLPDEAPASLLNDIDSIITSLSIDRPKLRQIRREGKTAARRLQVEREEAEAKEAWENKQNKNTNGTKQKKQNRKVGQVKAA